MKMFPSLLLSVLILGSFHNAPAWDPIGHMIIARIAETRLTPETRTWVDESLTAFNRHEMADYDFVSAACWMDDIRARTREYNLWHYVNLPFTAEGTPIPDGEKTPNVVWGIQHCEKVLAGEAPAEEKAQAMVILLHLEGDAHQPLHATGNEDAGGNRTEVSNLDNPAVDLLFSKGSNLHFFWDSAYRRTFIDGKVGTSYAPPDYLPEDPLAGHKAALGLVEKEAAQLMEKFPPRIVEKQGDAESWVLESHAIGFKFAYGELPAALADHTYALDSAYTGKAREIAQERLAMAGYRLGALLNRIHGKEK